MFNNNQYFLKYFREFTNSFNTLSSSSQNAYIFEKSKNEIILN